MYKQVPTDKSFQWHSGATSSGMPVATLADECGGKVQIIIDDGCYVIVIRQPGGGYKHSAWIFPEAFEVLRKLPPLTRYPEASLA